MPKILSRYRVFRHIWILLKALLSLALLVLKILREIQELMSRMLLKK